MRFPHSLGLLYSAFTYYTGFKVNSGEYKVMGLAACGTPRFIKEFRQLIRLEKDGTFKLNSDYFPHSIGEMEMTWSFGEPVLGRAYSDQWKTLSVRPAFRKSLSVSGIKTWRPPCRG